MAGSTPPIGSSSRYSSVSYTHLVTGESEYLTEPPEWVDHVYSAELIIEQYDYYGMYHNGFINSILGQRDVTVTTDGYNYIAEGDDVYLYTGVTSVGGDESNVGFLLSNQRTKETKYYPCAGDVYKRQASPSPSRAASTSPSWARAAAAKPRF